MLYDSPGQAAAFFLPAALLGAAASLVWRHIRKSTAAVLLLAGAFGTVWLRFGLSWHTFAYWWLAWILTGCGVTDAAQKRIPDALIALGFAGWGLLAVKNAWLGLSWLPALGGLILPALLLLAGVPAEKKLGRRLIGGGDIKLLSLTGVFLGWEGNLRCLLAAALLGLMYSLLKREKSFPWGPWLALGAWLAFLTERLSPFWLM